MGVQRLCLVKQKHVQSKYEISMIDSFVNFKLKQFKKRHSYLQRATNAGKEYEERMNEMPHSTAYHNSIHVESETNAGNWKLNHRYQQGKGVCC